MAGSLNHIIAANGSFTMDLIENLGDAHEALEECHAIIKALCRGNPDRLMEACKKVSAPTSNAFTRFVDREPWPGFEVYRTPSNAELLLDLQVRAVLPRDGRLALSGEIVNSAGQAVANVHISEPAK